VPAGKILLRFHQIINNELFKGGIAINQIVWVAKKYRIQQEALHDSVEVPNRNLHGYASLEIINYTFLPSIFKSNSLQLMRWSAELSN
jgi:hypothetical protein